MGYDFSYDDIYGTDGQELSEYNQNCVVDSDDDYEDYWEDQPWPPISPTEHGLYASAYRLDLNEHICGIFAQRGIHIERLRKYVNAPLIRCGIIYLNTKHNRFGYLS